MPESRRIVYHFENATSLEELELKAQAAVRHGWSTAGKPRPIELTFGNGLRSLCYSQVFARLEYEARRCEIVTRVDVSSSLPPHAGSCDHCVQFYETDDCLLDELEAFAADGLAVGESVVIIATPEHRTALASRLLHRGVEVASLKARDQLILADADESLRRFLVDGWPDQQRFEAMVGELLRRARRDGRRVRAFGEMVGILWRQGLATATVRLESLWHELCRREAFPLFCAYPKDDFSPEDSRWIDEICANHTRVLAARS